MLSRIHRRSRPAASTGSILLVAFLTVASAQDFESTQSMDRTRRNVDALRRILERTTNEEDRVQIQQRLRLEEQELENRQRRIALKEREQTIAQQQRVHTGYMLREAILSIESNAEDARSAARDKQYQILDLRRERAEMQRRRDKLEKDQHADEDELALLAESIRTMDERIFTLSLERNALEQRASLIREAERIEAHVDALPISPDPTIRLIHSKRGDLNDERKQLEDVKIQIAAAKESRKTINTSLTLSMSRLVQIDDEIALQKKRQRIEKTRQLRLPFFSASSKDRLRGLLDDRIQYQKAQLAAMDTSLETLGQTADLYEKELAVLSDDLSSVVQRYWKSVLIPISCILLIVLGHFLMSRLILPLVYRQDRLFVARRLFGYLSVLLIVLVIAMFFLEDLKAIATVLGIAGAALVIALQDLCSSFAGWFVIVASRKISVGDRVEIDEHSGDVIDIQLLRTTILEINKWLGIDEPTGRVIAIPNSFIFKNKVINYSHMHPFVWTRIEVTVTFETPAEECEALLRKILEEETSSEFAAATDAAVAMEKHYGSADTTYEPKMYSIIADSGVTFHLIYVSHYRRRTAVRNRINTRLIKEFNAREDINFAYPTQRHIPTAEPGDLNISVNPPPEK